MFAIWITGSTDASGKMPLRPAHSISKLRIRRGAILDQLPSGACEKNASYLDNISGEWQARILTLVNIT